MNEGHFFVQFRLCKYNVPDLGISEMLTFLHQLSETI